MPDSKTDSLAFDATLGQQSLEQLKPRLDALDAGKLARLNVDIEAAVIAALAVARRIHEPTLRARFQALPAAEFDISTVTDLGPAAWATWYALRQYLVESSVTSEARLPVALVQQATEVERRMQLCAEYHLGDHPTAGPWLALLRPHSGHRDVASDLAGYADIYEQHLETLQKDTRHFRADDLPLARKLSAEILRLLGDRLSPEARSWQTSLARCWTLLLSLYAEVAAAGSWLERHSPNVAQLYPSLHTMGRSTPRTPTPEPTPGPTPTPVNPGV